jgi:hypothetical protein
MGSVGDALDNAMCESLISTLRREKLSRETYRSVDEVRSAVFHWIEAWHNRRRRHSSLGMFSPLEYESQHRDGHTSQTSDLSGKAGEAQPPRTGPPTTTRNARRRPLGRARKTAARSAFPKSA